MIGINIRNIKINNITFVKNKGTMTGYFLIDMYIYPINLLDSVSMMLEVK